jgi:polyisoprenoid-binding protein YceI
MRLTTLVWFLAAIVLPQSAHGICRSIPENSELLFVASFEGQEIPGLFSEFSVTLDSASDEGSTTALEVRVNITTADMDDSDINEAISAPEWFDFASHPQAFFRSSDIRPASSGAWLAYGELDLKGIQKSITVPFKWTDNGSTTTMTGSLALSRNDFGIGSGEWAEDDSIGEAVRVEFNVTLDCTANE